MSWLKVSRLAETSGLGPHQMLRRLKALNRKVNGRLLRREGDRGNWQVSESVLVEIREAERARAEEGGRDVIGWSDLVHRIDELEATVAALRDSHREHRRSVKNKLELLNSRTEKIETSFSSQTSFSWLQNQSSESPPTP